MSKLHKSTAKVQKIKGGRFNVRRAARGLLQPIPNKGRFATAETAARLRGRDRRPATDVHALTRPKRPPPPRGPDRVTQNMADRHGLRPLAVWTVSRLLDVWLRVIQQGHQEGGITEQLAARAACCNAILEHVVGTPNRAQAAFHVLSAVCLVVYSCVGIMICEYLV